MKVKIKQGNEMLDATIEMVGGVMVVSPKEVKFEPKDGDVLSSDFNGRCQGIFVFKKAGECSEAIFHVALDDNGKIIKGDGRYFFGYVDNIRPATENEKKKLFDKLEEEGYEWDAEKKELVKIKWKPKDNDNYWSPSLFDSEFIPWKNSWQNSKIGNKRLEKGWVFRTDKECQEFCNRLNDTINSVKP